MLKSEMIKEILRETSDGIMTENEQTAYVWGYIKGFTTALNCVHESMVGLSSLMDEEDVDEIYNKFMKTVENRNVINVDFSKGNK